MIRPGKHIADVSGPLQRVAEAYGCNMVEGVLSHEVKQFVIDGSKCILNKPTPDHKARADATPQSHGQPWAAALLSQRGRFASGAPC